MSKKSLWLAVGLLAMGLASQSRAAENGTLAYPGGSSAIFGAAFPPMAGVFAISQLNFTDATALYNSSGNKLATPFTVHTYSETLRLLASYGTKILGADMYSQLVVPYVHGDESIYGVGSTANGVSNVTISPLILAWHLPHYQQAVLGLDIATATGAYNPNQFSVAQGYNSFQPTFGYRYNNPNGLDVGAVGRFLVNAKNDSTNYQSGSAFVLDYTAGWNVGPFKLGVVGAYSDQFSGDTAAGVDIGNAFKEFKIGPSIAYSWGPTVINLNYQQDVYVENGAKTGSLWLNIAFPLYVPR